jgi:tricorn protease
MRWSILALLLVPAAARADADPPRLLYRPAVSAAHVAFVHAGDLWVVNRGGGDARRLTAGVGLESHPVFSPDGSQVAFAGEYDGNLDVYVVPTAGGEPKRLTYHPDPDLPTGWTPDGKAVVFRSTRSSYSRFTKLFTVPASGGDPTELPLPMAEEGSLSPDGKRIAYVPFTNTRAFPGASIAWKKYRGGKAPFIWVADLATLDVEKVPHTDANDFNPMWVGETVYFLSDRDGPTALYAYDLGTKKVRRLTDAAGPDIKSAGACADAIVFDKLDGLYLYDLKAGKAEKLAVTVRGDLPGVRSRAEKVARQVQNADLSPTGARAVFEARGEILTVPAEKGSVRNLTNSPGVADRDPSWSPDGKTVASFSDEGGEYELVLRPQNGIGEVKRFTLGDAPSFYYNPTWSPDGKRIAYADKRRNLWLIDLATGKNTKADTDPFPLGAPLAPVWSPDSKWLAYARSTGSMMAAVFLYEVESGKQHQATDGMSDARSPAFDKNGKYLYFTASTDVGPLAAGSMSAFNRAATRTAYVIVLGKSDPSPLAPESDDEKDAKPADKKDAAEKKEKDPPAVTVDVENLDQRTLPLPLPARGYVGLIAGKAGTLFLLEGESVFAPRRGPSPGVTVHRMDVSKRKAEKLLDGAHSVVLSRNGEKLLYRSGPDKWFIVSATGMPPAPGTGALKTDDLEVRVDPRAEWRQIHREAWRLQRDFLYDPGAHGLDLKAAEKRYEPYLAGLGSRHDLNVLLEEGLGELALGHVYISGGDTPEPKDPKTGLLGADYVIEGGRYKFARIYRGEGWNPDLHAPLLQPGASVKEGEFLLAVNGRDLKPGGDELFKAFEGTAGKQTVIRVGPTADGKDSREITVTPVANERSLRNLAWVDDNRRKVEKLSGGKVAYVYVPDTSGEGFARFNRYYFAQTDKQGVVIDERFNGGGQLADHIVDFLRMPVRNYIMGREGKDVPFPRGAVPGPKAMVVNEFAGSGGDYLPYTFRQADLGPLVGKRTWGGLVGIGGYPTLIDSGQVTAPRMGIWFPNGRWDVENRGVAPDVEVEHDPKLVKAGRDPQLEKAVELVLAQLKQYPPAKPTRPPFPNYYTPGLKEPAEGK